jgi:DNA-binding NtrC family response regulator
MAKMNIRLLLVEDDQGDVRLIREMLKQVEHVDYEIWHVSTLREGLVCLKESSFDVLLLDLGLPDSQNLATFVRFKVAAPNLPVIVLTGFDDGELARTALRKGSQDFLVKGHVDTRLLDCSIRYAIERQRLVQRTAKVNETLIAAERNRVVQETAGGVAHEINQPLTVVTVVADHLLNTIDASDPNYDLIVSLQAATARIDKIVKDMQLAKRYATRPYTELCNILDLEAASGPTGSAAAKSDADTTTTTPG